MVPEIRLGVEMRGKDKLTDRVGHIVDNDDIVPCLLNDT